MRMIFSITAALRSYQDRRDRRREEKLKQLKKQKQMSAVKKLQKILPPGNTTPRRVVYTGHSLRVDLGRRHKILKHNQECKASLLLGSYVVCGCDYGRLLLTWDDDLPNNHRRHVTLATNVEII